MNATTLTGDEDNDHEPLLACGLHHARSGNTAPCPRAGGGAARLAEHRDVENPLGRFRIQEWLPGRGQRRALAGASEVQSGGRGLHDADHAGERDRLARGHAGLRRQDAPAGRDLGRADGCQDGAPDRQHRDRLRHGPPRPEDRRADGGRSAAAHARLPSGRPATLPRRHRALGCGQGQRRQVPHPAAGLPGQRAGRVFRRHVSHLLGDVCGARLPGRGQDRSGGRTDEADQDLSARQGRGRRLRCSS